MQETPFPVPVADERLRERLPFASDNNCSFYLTVIEVFGAKHARASTSV